METFADLITSPTPVLVDIYADWCAPCKAMAPVLEQVKKMQGDSLRIIKVNIDRQPRHTKDGQVDCRATFQH